MVTLWGTAEVKGLLCLRLHQHERKEWWHFRNLEKKLIKNINTLSGFVCAELPVSCVAAGGWLQGEGHHLRCVCPSGGEGQPRHCTGCAGSSLDGSIPTGTAGLCSCSSSQGGFPPCCCTIGAITESSICFQGGFHPARRAGRLICQVHYCVVCFLYSLGWEPAALGDLLPQWAPHHITPSSGPVHLPQC